MPGQIGNWDYTLDLIGQLGNYRDTRAGAPSERLEHQAYAVVAQGGYTFKETWGTPRVGFEYAHGSGDSDPNDGNEMSLYACDYGADQVLDGRYFEIDLYSGWLGS